MYLKPISFRRRRVLVVDDDSATRGGIGRILTSHGFDALDAVNGRNAGKMLETERVDLVITDIFMPECDGFELIAAVRRMKHPVPIIAMSGREAWTGLNFLDAANDLGASAVLQKPFLATALLQLVAQLLDSPDGGAGINRGAENKTQSWNVADFEHLIRSVP